MRVLAFWGALLLVVLLGGCSNEEHFTAQHGTITFTQDYNPPYIDVLWMVDDRSPMYDGRVNLTNEARNFFARLDASATQYRMATVSADMQYAKGALRPRGNPVVLTKGLGTIDQRTSAFASMIAQQINLQTSAFNRGMESALKALTTSFVPQQNVPLVVVFLSYSEDESTVTGDKVTYYKNALLSLKANKPELLRVYSVNYVTGGKRCAQEFGNPIDAGGYVPYYFNLATAVGGSTADLCGSFSSTIDLSGLRLKALPKSFTLESVPSNPSSIQVTVSKDAQALPSYTWKYNAATNSIDFDQTPPEGAVIQVVFL